MADFLNFSDCRDDFYDVVLNILSADGTNDRANQIIDAFDTQPTVDAVAVVRCKDCKYYKNEDADEYGTCVFLSERKHIRWEDDYDVRMRPIDFCSWGRRKELDNG